MAAQKSVSPHRLAERKRRRRELIAVGVAGATLVAFVFAQTELPPLTRHTSLVSNLAVISLFNLSFLLLGLMLFLVGRNLAKVIFERRRGLIGSKFQVRLVSGFIAVALIPSAFLLYVSGVFLHADINSWFNPEYEQILNDSLEIAKTYYLNSANNASHFARVLAGEISARGLLAPQKRDDLKAFINKRQEEYNLGTIEVFSADRKLLLIDLSPKTPTGIGASPDSPIISQTLKGQALTRTDRLGSADVIRGSAPIYVSSDTDNVLGALLVDYYLPQSLATRASNISRVSEDYFQLRILRQPIMNSYLLTLVLIGLVVVTLASWFGIFLSRGITGPIKLLARGTQAIAGGDLNFRIPAVGDDEIGHLVDSFNQMTADLRASAAELERRRQYTETLLRNVSAGVVGLDHDGAVTTINPCAERLLDLRAADVIGRSYQGAFPPALARVLDDVFAFATRPREARSTIKLEIAASETELMMTASPLGDAPNEPAGTVLFFEDVSQIAKVERIEAWREVARRIAHEIKNPLTPIQLSAERLRRQLGARPGIESTLVEECTKTIIGEVEDLKRLVNEFSAFARMPHLNPVPGDINALASETVANFREANPNVEFALALDPAIPLIPIDRDAMKRALVNLLDNAVAAVTAINHNGARPQIEVRSHRLSDNSLVTLEVADNGPGIDPRLRTRIFEPYYSSKKGGTGLGLAIVSAVVTDHHGFVRVTDNRPCGSRFVVEFPVKMRQFAKATG
ncbi:MAG TPA: ATP-binding protein [Candidatus Binatus sp.]|uniref:sensor histidine kinase n=1 Tax=Candidatus Binatus sp. TaxID=2811406 RepID=UPI002B46D607|nr:ATP-binding protein [Candidatus Binatus sp.]HKN12883.1 ATP-binding protein [Candidatus Binatus sp.]